MRILDLGCGRGINLDFFNVGDGTVYGVDVSHASLSGAVVKFPHRKFCSGSGEALPFRDGSMDEVVSKVALLYMNIPHARHEIHRVLVPVGTVSASLHYFRSLFLNCAAIRD